MVLSSTVLHGGEPTPTASPITSAIQQVSGNAPYEAKPVAVKPAAPTFPLNEAVASYCEMNVGRRVGNGQCASLNQQALAYTRARGMGYGSRGEYIWGKHIATFSPGSHNIQQALRPGDMLQFHGAQFNNKSAYHHSAVVRSVSEDGQTVYVYEQNSAGRLYVIKDLYDMRGLRSGYVQVYRPTN
jgi:hypothetical protein